jgi:A/G-specific adenine glycosylase
MGSKAERSPPLSPPAIANLQRRLLRWYDRHARPLPWRASTDPYRVWVAEVMLQQTRVAVVVPAYERFLKRFPTLPRLAAAGEDDVLSLWSGLGYYRRGRNLWRAARAIVDSGAAAFPDQRRAALALPGVGEYTAAAVLSIAYRRPLAAVDGNVMRVLARLFRQPPPSPAGEPYRSLAQSLLVARRPGSWNQALMELGETICLPKAPQCPRCPVSSHCQALRTASVARHPAPKPRRARERVDLELALVRDRQGNLLLERGAFRHLSHLWLPLSPPLGAPIISPPVANFRHAILHRDFAVALRTMTLSKRELRNLAGDRRHGSERRIFAPAELNAIGRSSLLTKAIAAAANAVR